MIVEFKGMYFASNRTFGPMWRVSLVKSETLPPSEEPELRLSQSYTPYSDENKVADTAPEAAGGRTEIRSKSPEEADIIAAKRKQTLLESERPAKIQAVVE